MESDRRTTGWRPGGPVADLSYTEASHELDEIVAFFEQREIDVDQLVARLERATAIVDELDRRLRRTRAQVEELVPRLQGATTADAGRLGAESVDGVPGVVDVEDEVVVPDDDRDVSDLGDRGDFDDDRERPHPTGGRPDGVADAPGLF
jgi:exodeoxyribonuclease VII small subunit